MQLANDVTQQTSDHITTQCTLSCGECGSTHLDLAMWEWLMNDTLPSGSGSGGELQTLDLENPGSNPVLRC